MSGTGSPRPAASTSRKRTGSSVPSASRRGPINSSAKWSASCWRHTTSRSSQTTPTGSAKAADATPHCGKSVTFWKGTTWFIEGDISDCFGSLDHEIMVQILAEKVHDQRFLRLIRHMLKAGYLEDWEYHDTLSGVPQGGVASPVLSNIYLNKLDEFVERELIPRYTRGASRKRNPEYMRIRHRRETAQRHGDRAAARDLLRQMRTLPSRDPMDPGYRRLRYSRYADDHILGFTGPKAEAEQIKARLAQFLRDDLGLELNAAKTLITHARSQRARFLGYDITVQHSSTKISNGRRSVNGKIALRVPPDVVKAKTAPYRRRGKPWHRPGLQNLDAYDIVRAYGAEYR